MDNEKIVILLLMLASFTSWFFVASSFTNSYDDTVSNINLETVYDAPSKEFQEISANCRECGDLANGMNHEVVCRNEDCPLYGVPIKID